MSGRTVRRNRRPGHSFPQASDDAPDGAWSGRSYEELYVEYAPAARGLALSMVPPDVADDIVAEAFARVLAAIRAGGDSGMPIVVADPNSPQAKAFTAIASAMVDGLGDACSTDAPKPIETLLQKIKRPLSGNPQ